MIFRSLVGFLSVMVAALVAASAFAVEPSMIPAVSERVYPYPILINAILDDGLSPPLGATVSNEQGKRIGTVSREGRILVSALKNKTKLTVRWGDKRGEQCVLEYVSANTQKSRFYEVLNAGCTTPVVAAYTDNTDKTKCVYSGGHVNLASCKSVAIVIRPMQLANATCAATHEEVEPASCERPGTPKYPVVHRQPSGTVCQYKDGEVDLASCRGVGAPTSSEAIIDVKPSKVSATILPSVAFISEVVKPISPIVSQTYPAYAYRGLGQLSLHLSKGKLKANRTATVMTPMEIYQPGWTNAERTVAVLRKYDQLTQCTENVPSIFNCPIKKERAQLGSPCEQAMSTPVTISPTPKHKASHRRYHHHHRHCVQKHAGKCLHKHRAHTKHKAKTKKNAPVVFPAHFVKYEEKSFTVVTGEWFHHVKRFFVEKLKLDTDI